MLPARKAKEAKEAKEKADERAKEKEAAERLAEKLVKKSYEPFTLQFSGKDTNDLMRNMLCILQPNTDFSDLMGRFNITV